LHKLEKLGETPDPREVQELVAAVQNKSTGIFPFIKKKALETDRWLNNPNPPVFL
jgi:hypothetical protein